LWGETAADLLPPEAWEFSSDQARQFVLSDRYFNVMDGGMGSGKTWALCQRAVRVAERDAPIPYLLASPTYPNQRDTVLPALWEVLASTAREWEHREQARRVLLPQTGAEIWLTTAETPDHTMRGPTVGGVGLDEGEQMRPRALRLAHSRARHPGARICCVDVSTTPEGFTTLHEDLGKAWPGGTLHVQVPTTANRFRRPGYEDTLRETFDVLTARAYIGGERICMTLGQVYHQFRRALHVRPCPYNPLLPLECWMDFNGSPMSMIFAQAHGPEIWIIGESLLWSSDTTRAAAWMRLDLRLRDEKGAEVKPATLPRVYCDPAGVARQHTTGTSDVEALRDAGFQVSHPHHGFRVREGVNVVNALLLDGAGKTRLFLDGDGLRRGTRDARLAGREQDRVDVLLIPAHRRLRHVAQRRVGQPRRAALIGVELVGRDDVVRVAHHAIAKLLLARRQLTAAEVVARLNPRHVGDVRQEAIASRLLVRHAAENVGVGNPRRAHLRDLAKRRHLFRCCVKQ